MVEKIKNILVAVAGRGLCEEMVNMLLEVPDLQDASITVLHVVPEQASADTMAENLERGGKILAEAVKSIKVDASKVNPRLKQGDPKTIVCDVAKEENSDLIIMGSRAMGRLLSILENSVSQYVFQLADRPMLLVKDEIYVTRLRRILVALDRSEEAQKGLNMALFLAKGIKDTQLVLAHINPPDADAPPEKDPVLAAAAAEAKKLGIKYTCVVADGKAGPEICGLADEKNADLVVLGSPDRRPSIAKTLPDLDRLLGTSKSDYVRVNADCPVLLVR